MKHKFHWLNEKIEPRSTGAYGTGLFAKKNIKQGRRRNTRRIITSAHAHLPLGGKNTDK
jgi:hypothetical protein